MGKVMGLWKAFMTTGALLLVGKLGLNEYVRQDAMGQVIVNAYREHAIAACRHKAGTTIKPASWAQPSGVRLAVGKSDLDVYLWQTGHRLWNARYRNAYIYVTIDEPASQVHCEYDITNDIAMVYQLGGRDYGNQMMSN